MRPAKTSSILAMCLLVISAALATPRPAAAQQQEKRIALVVGNGAYAKSPLATTANDAGLIAQTLQAAGFDVVGARDLDGETLRKSFHDFVQKAQSSGPDTVAMVYLSGYGVQLAGENYFIPVDSTISRDTDIPIEGLRISDYTRQLASLPLKASIVVLDAARQQPFIEGGQPIASGLALVEPEANMLIAFNAAPGTVAPSEAGPYGIYAQSLAEMIRTGGLPLPDVFDRLRLRVNEASKGAQVPWDDQKIQSPFAFFDRAPDAPPVQGAPDQVAALRDRPIRDLAVQDAYAAALERDTLQAYEDFLATYPNDPLARRVRAIVAARREAITWRRTYRTDTPQAYWSYLRRYPQGPHAADARRRLAILTAPLEPPPAFAVIDYDVPPPPPDEIIYVDRPVLYFGDPDFGFLPPPPPPVYYLPPPPPDFVVLPPPIAPVGLFILPQPMFVAMPVYVRPPVYVAPPPNNVIFNNIHNTTVINNVINQPPPAPTPGAPAGPIAPRGAGAVPSLPPAVAQRATLIQQGKLPVPPSATITPTVRGGTPTPAPVTVTPNVLPQGLPKTNALPVPGAKGAPPPPPPPPPPAAGGPSPGGKLIQPVTTPSGTPRGTPSPAPTLPKGAAPVVIPPKPAITHIQPTPTPSPTLTPLPRGQKIGVPPPPPPPPPKPQIQQRITTPPPVVHTPPPPPPVVHAPPPPPAARITTPPPVVHAPPPPPPVVHAPPPPPAARIATPPPPVVHAAPPPPPPPHAPPPAARAPAPAKKCPPNNPRC